MKTDKHASLSTAGNPLSPGLAHIANSVRRRLEHRYSIDTSGLDDQTFLAHVILLKQIADSRGMGIVQALAVYSGKFMDIAELAGEMMAVPKGTRH